MISSASAVPKPATAGTGVRAIAITTGAYANIRNGPGVGYLDIGDINNNTIVLYYPNSRTADGWVWVEQGQVGGWVSTAVVRFEATGAQQPSTTPTPYDGKVAIWHWKGDSLPENSIDEVVRNLRRNAPNLKAVFVKTSDYTTTAGARWQGYWDTKRELAIDGPASIDRWVQVLERSGLEFHAWCVPRGVNINTEGDLIVQACQRPGVRSMILDVEPYEGFWLGGREAIRPLMAYVRRQIPGSFHIGLAVDPRSQWYRAIYPEEWFPFVNSVHPMVYWATFRQSPDVALANAFQVWGSYGRPIIPILQADASVGEMSTATTLAVQRHAAPGVSWWRLGVVTPAGWTAVNQPVSSNQPPPPGNDDSIEDEQVVRPGDQGFAKGSYTGQPEFLSFTGTWGWTVFYKATETQRSKVWVQWTPRLAQSGKYEVSIFVPYRHATTRAARYKIHGVRGTSTQVTVSIDQSRFSNQWVSLGVFDLDKSAVNAGAVFVNDLTFETGLSIAFDAIRWRRISDQNTPPPTGPNLADGYDSPVGTEVERRSRQVWPGRWYDASPFAQLYLIGTPSEAYHTGADLNLPGDSDRFAALFAVASGVITFAGRLPVWGNVIVIKHDPLARNGRVMYSRYGHVHQIIVRVGQRVRRGQQIATIGNAFGAFGYHLHFDLSPTNILEAQPQHWPARNLQDLLRNYVDPRAFIEQNRP